MKPPCPEEGVLAAFLQEGLEESDRRGGEEHLADCFWCRAVAGSAVRGLDRRPISEQAALFQGDAQAAFQVLRPELASMFVRRWSPARIAAVAAGIMVAVSIGLWAWPGGNGGPRSGVPARRSSLAPSEVFREGTRVWRLEPETRLDEAESAPGGRLQLRMEQGDVRFDVPPGRGLWSLRTPAGEVRVQGTAFRVRTVHLPLDRESVPLTFIEVEEGTVSIHNDAGSGPIHAGHRGILWKGESPVTQIQSGTFTPELFARAFQSLARDPAPRLEGSAWIAVLSFYREAAPFLLERFPGLTDPRERSLAARLVRGWGTDLQRAELLGIAKAQGDRELVETLQGGTSPEGSR